MATTRSRFDAELARLRERLLAMGSECEQMLGDAVAALTAEDGAAGDALAESIARRDDAVDEMESRVEAEALRLIALQQPVVASDLRLVFVALKATTDIERIGDHCVNVARLGRQMRREGVFYKPLIDIPLLAGSARSMLHEALESIVHHDAERARAVIAADERTDDLYRRMRGSLQDALAAGETDAARLAPFLLFAIHYLERIGDHCINIAERVVFLEEGRRVDSPDPDEPSGSA